MSLLSPVQGWFAQLFDVLKSVGRWLYDSFVDFIGAFLRLPEWVVSIYVYVGACLITVFTVTYDTFTLIVTLLGRITGNLEMMEKGTFAPGTPAGDLMTGINTFFPLDIGIQFLVSYAFVYLTCAIIRMCKAWIPTLT